MTRRFIGWMAGIAMLAASPVLGQENDTMIVIDEAPFTNFDQNLDSLLNLYYVRLSADAKLQEWNTPDTLIPDFPDSVYVERIRRIPSVVQLSFNRVVKNYIDVYTLKKRENMEVMLGLTDYYFPVFEQIFDRYNLPTELKYLAIIESALNPRAVSKVGAVGIWQFMYGTGRMYNLTINSLVDERRDPLRSTDAAARYLKDLYSIYKDWVLVIAAYNCGPGNVNKAIRRSGYKRDYWDIYYYLPRETRGYVPAYIAASYVVNYYQEHNLVPKPINLPETTDTLMISQELHLRQVSEVLGIPLSMLRDMNPQYRRDVIPARGTRLSLTLPAPYTTQFIDLEDSIFAYKDSLFFNDEALITNPTYSRYVPEPPTGKTKLVYTVKTGDNLGYIASWYNVQLSDLRYWNNIRRNLIRAGQHLAIYVSPSLAERYRRIDSMSFEEKQKMVGGSTVIEEAVTAAPPSEVLDEAEYVYYIVKSGDTLWEIAKDYPGVSDADIMKLNNLKYGDKIQPGQRLKIMKKG
jgi:membrane-bound lytic murein transglycosylase D